MKGYKPQWVKGRGAQDKEGRKRAQASRVLSQRSSSGRTQFPPAISWENTCKMLSPGKLTGDAVPGVSTGGWSRRHFLAGTYQNSRLPEGEQVLIVNQIIYKTSWGTVSHPDQFWKQWEPTRNPSSQMPVKGQPGQQAFVMLAASGLLSYLFSAQIHTRTGTPMGTE